MSLVGIPFNLDDLLNLRSIESHRVEFKATWDENIRPAVVKSVCAFANDLLNLNGGYIVLGIEEVGGRPQFPPRGLDGLNVELIQQEIRGDGHKIQPNYFPVLFPTDFQSKSILVIWAPGGDNRPYQAPDGEGRSPAYFVRQGPQTIAAKGEVLRQLMELAAKIPFDDRKNTVATVDTLSATLVRRFLQDVGSELVAPGQNVDAISMYRSLRIIAPVNAHEVPRNVGLMFFTDDPDIHFLGARIEVVQFGDDAGGDLIEERIFRGPVDQQIKQTLQFLDGLGGTSLQKVRGQAEVERTVPYPYEAMEEAIVNAIYHRGYDGPPEPTKIYLYPDRTELLQPYLMMARNLIDGGKSREASDVLRRMPPSNNFAETLEAAILKRRSGDFEGAHHLFAQAYSLNPDDPKVVHEFAQSKLSLARSLYRDGTGRRGKPTVDIRRRLNQEAVELLRRALALTDDTVRQAWCWFDLARTLQWLHEPKSEIEAAYLKARALAPHEPKFVEGYERWKRER